MDSVGTDMSDSANQYKLAGNDFFNANNYTAAIKEYLKGLEFNCKSADLHSNLSAAYLCMENYNEAREHGLFAFYLKPEWYKSYIRVARALQGQGEAGQAVKCLEEGLHHVKEPEGRNEIIKLIAEYKYFPLYTEEKNGNLLKVSKDSNVDKDSDSESEIALDNAALTDIIKKQTITIPVENKDSQIIEDDSSEFHTSQNVTTENEKTDLAKEKKETVEENKETADNSNIFEELLRSSYNKKNKERNILNDKNCEGSGNNETNSTGQDLSLLKKDFLGVLPNLDRPSVPKTLQTLIREGFQAVKKNNYYKAIENYKAAREIALANENDVTTCEAHVIHYAINVISIELGTYDELVQAMHNFSDVTTEYFCCKPSAQYNCARIYYRLNRFKEALEPLQSCLEAVEYHPFMKHLWPGSLDGDFFAETTRSGLKECANKLQQLCRVPPALTAICRYPNCLSLSTHIAPSTHIYLGDPDFIGYVTITCQEKCRIEFHINCWKTLRDDQVSKVGKTSDKDMLGRPCITEDCVLPNGERSLINSISITGQDGQVKTNMKYEPVVNKNSDQSVSKKSKKKRSKSSDEKTSKDKLTCARVPKSKSTFKKKEAPVAVGTKSTNIIAASSNSANLKKSLEDRINFLDNLRAQNFGLSPENYLNPQYIYYGNEEEQLKKENSVFLDSGVNFEENASGVKEAKEFLFSYFHSVLEKDGFQKIEEIEEKWKVADDLFDIKTVLPNMISISDVLLESTRFCLLDDTICLSDQLPETYNETRVELVESVDFMINSMSDLEHAKLPTENYLEPLQCFQAPITQNLKQESAIQEGPLTNVNQNLYQQQIDELQNFYTGDDSSEESTAYSFESSDDDDDDDDDLDHNSEAENDDPAFPKHTLSTLANLNTIEQTENDIFDYILQMQENQMKKNSEVQHPLTLNKEKDQLVIKPDNCDMECQTDESEIKQTLELKNKIKSLYQEIATLKNSLMAKNTEIEKSEHTHNKQLQKLEDEKCKILEKQDKYLKRLKAETTKNEEALKKENEILQNKNKELTTEISVSSLLVKQAEKFQEVMQKAVGDNMVKKHKAVLGDMNSRKTYCEFQIESFKRRCKEKMSEYTSLLNFCKEDSKDLPCWHLIKEHIKLWEDTLVQVNKTEHMFQELYNQLNDKIARGEDVEDISVLKLSGLPKEPVPLELDKLLHKILERYEKRQCPPQIVYSTAPTVPFVNQQNSYFAPNPLLGHPIYTQPAAHFFRLPPPAIDPNLNQIPVLPVLKNSRKPPMTDLPNTIDTSIGPTNITSSVIDTTLTLPIVNANSVTSKDLEDPLPSRTIPSSDTFVGLADDQQLERPSSCNSSASRDFTPQFLKPSVKSDRNNCEGVKNNTKAKQKSKTVSNKVSSVKPKSNKPELVMDRELIDKIGKKKKKCKQAKEPIVDKRLCKSPSPVLSEGMDFGATSSFRGDDISSDKDSVDWQYIDRKKKTVIPSSTEPIKIQQKNKIKLLDTLKIKFLELNLKELDELVMIVRQQNGDSLSGLPIGEISSRVEKLLADRFLKKASTMGLEKFNDGAWGGVNEEDTDWSKIAPDECTICLESMKSEQTTLECNHIFHTACIRQWLQEKSVCPLCIKFSTMPDEYPYLNA